MAIRAQLLDLEGEIVRCVAGLGYGATADGGAIGGAEGGAKSTDEAAPFFGHAFDPSGEFDATLAQRCEAFFAGRGVVAERFQDAGGEGQRWSTLLRLT